MSVASRMTLFLLASFLVAFNAGAWDRGKVERFATLPKDALNPEGIAVEPRSGDVYVTGFNPTGKGPAQIYVFDSDGNPKGDPITVSPASSALLGLDFHPTTHRLLVIDFGAGNVLDVNPITGAATVFMPATAGDGLNALTFDHAGNVYVSASFSGRVYRTGPAGGSPIVWAEDPTSPPPPAPPVPQTLKPDGFPPFGANGLQFNSDESALLVANTANDTIVRIPNNGGEAGKPEVFTNSINGADGLFVDKHDNVWVCANQSDEIVVVDKTGKAISKLGDFGGIKDGKPVGLLFPASLVRSGEWIYITNLSLDLRPVVGQQSIVSQYAAQVKRHTIARIRARVLGFEHGGHDD
jgi:SMP-30/gluconolaconase/LRE-like protein